MGDRRYTEYLQFECIRQSGFLFTVPVAKGASSSPIRHVKWRYIVPECSHYKIPYAICICTDCAAHIHTHFIHSWIIKVCTNSNHSSLLFAAPIDGECIMCMSIHSSRYYIQKICWKKKHNKGRERERERGKVACYWNISASHSNVWEITVTFQKLLKLCRTKLK